MFLTRTGTARIALWRVALQAIQERPFLGWGLENFSTAFTEYFNPCFGSISCGHEVWFDRSHNYFLDLLISGGVVAIVAFSGLLFTIFYTLNRAYLELHINKLSILLVVTFFMVYLVQGLAGFDTSVILLMLMFVFAYISGFSKMVFNVVHNKTLLSIAIFFTFLFPVFFIIV